MPDEDSKKLPAPASRAGQTLPKDTDPSKVGVVYKLTWIVTRAMMYPLGPLDIQGRENVPTSGPVIVASNHRAHVDPPYVSQITKRHIFYMAKEELFTTSKPFAKLLYALGAFPVRRGESDRGALRQAIALLKQGRVLGIFPEGTRSFDKTLLPPEKGFALIAKQTGAPIVPVALEGTDRILPKGTSRVHRGKVCITVGKPVTAQEILNAYEGDDKDTLDIIGREIMRRIAELMRQK